MHFPWVWNDFPSIPMPFQPTELAFLFGGMRIRALRTGAAKNPWEPIFSIFRFRALRARTYFLPKFPPIFTREPIFCQNFLRAAREPILVFFMYNFAPKIHGKLKIPQIFPALRAGTYFLPKFSRASRANLFFSILKI